MENYTFYNTTKIIFGSDAEKQVGRETAVYSDKALVVHYGDAFIQKSGILDRVKESLQDSGVKVYELSGIQPNPVLKPVLEGIRMCREEKIGFILAVGGGSCIDTAKAIGVGALFDGNIWDLFTYKETTDCTLPVGCVLTIPATGSESSAASVMINEATGEKLLYGNPVMRPKFAVLNPEITLTLPAWQTFCGVTDIFSHVVERYFTDVKNTDLTDRMCEGVMRSVIENARILLREPGNLNARAEIMQAGTVAHNDVLSMGRNPDWCAHDLGNELSARYNTTHGATLSIMHPALMRYVFRWDLERYVQFAERVWEVEADREHPEKTALEGIRRMENFFKEIGMPVRISQLKLDAEVVPEELAKSITKDRPAGFVLKLGYEDVLAVVKTAI